MNRMETLDRATFVGKAKEMAAQLREYEAQSSEQRFLHEQSVALIRDSGLFRLVQPKRIGGYEMDIATFRTDKSLEDQGAWTSIGGDARVKLARIGNRRYRDALQARLKPHRRAIRATRGPLSTNPSATTRTSISAPS